MNGRCVNDVATLISKFCIVLDILYELPLQRYFGGASAWIYAGGAHHTVFSQALTAEHIYDFSEMAGIEYVLIDRATDLRSFASMLRTLLYTRRKQPADSLCLQRSSSLWIVWMMFRKLPVLVKLYCYKVMIRICRNC